MSFLSFAITGAGTNTITLSHECKTYIVTGTASISAGQTVAFSISGTPSTGRVISILWEAELTLANSATAIVNFFGGALQIKGDGSGDLPAIYSQTNFGLVAYWNGSSWQCTILPNFNDGLFVDAEHIAVDSVANTKLANMAANTIKVRDANSTGDPSDKALADTQILICNGSGFTAAALSSDVTMANTGAVTIANLAVTTAKINTNAVTNAKLAGMTRGTIKVGSAAGAASDLALGTSGKILVSDGSDPNWVAVSGDATLSSTGALTIVGDGAVKKTSLTIASAQVLTLNSVPQIIVAAPGSGKAIQVVNASWKMTYGGTAYATNTTLQLMISGGSNAQATATNGLAAVANVFTAMPVTTAATGTLLVTNQPLTVTVQTGDPTTGNSNITVYVSYVIIDV